MTLLRMMLHKLKKVNWIKKELDSNVKKLDRTEDSKIVKKVTSSTAMLCIFQFYFGVFNFLR